MNSSDTVNIIEMNSVEHLPIIEIEALFTQLSRLIFGRETLARLSLETIELKSEARSIELQGGAFRLILLPFDFSTTPSRAQYFLRVAQVVSCLRGTQFDPEFLRVRPLTQISPPRSVYPVQIYDPSLSKLHASWGLIVLGEYKQGLLPVATAEFNELPMQLQLRLKCELTGLSIGANLEELSISGIQLISSTRVFAAFADLQGRRLRITEEQDMAMEEEGMSLTIEIGAIEVRAEDLAKLRVGSEVEFSLPPMVHGVLRVGAVPWAAIEFYVAAESSKIRIKKLLLINETEPEILKETLPEIFR